MAYRLEIRLAGEHLTPESISASDVGQLITAFEKMLIGLVRPNAETKKRDVLLGLSAIRTGSYILEFTTSHPAEIQSASYQLSEAIQSGNFRNIPQRVKSAFHDTQQIVDKYGSNLQLWENNGKAKQLAVIQPSQEPKEFIISEQITLYGNVISVYGDNPPHARLRLLDGSSLRCKVTERNNLHVARMLAQKLYEVVRVRGHGQKNIRTGRWESFFIEEMLAYEPKPATEVLHVLRSYAGNKYTKVEDIDTLFAYIRGSDAEHEIDE